MWMGDYDGHFERTLSGRPVDEPAMLRRTRLPARGERLKVSVQRIEIDIDVSR